MATLIENDIKELKDFIGGQLKEVNRKIDKLSEEVIGLKVNLATIKGELTGINKRIDNLEFTNQIILVAIIVALIAVVVKVFFPNLINNF